MINKIYKYIVNKVVKKKEIVENQLKNIFTPSTSATLTYVRRNEIDEELEKSFQVIGRQIVVYGHSGSGKSTLVNNILRNNNRISIVTNCTPESTIDSIIREVFDRLRVYAQTETNTKKTKKFSSKLNLKSPFNSVSYNGELRNEENVKNEKVVDFQLTPQRLAEILGENSIVWVIEDFHKVIELERDKLSQILKIFVDVSNRYNDLKVICIGAVGTARELVKFNPELINRIAEIHVPLMKRTELEEIIHKGESILNIAFDKLIINDIINLSNSLASICHHLCWYICYNKKIESRQPKTVIIGNEALESAIVDYLKQNSDNFKELFDKLLRDRESKLDFFDEFLKEICRIKKEEFDVKDIQKSRTNKKRFKGQELKYLELLTTTEYGELMRYDPNADKFYFSNPFTKAYLIMNFKNIDKEFMSSPISNDETFNRLIEYLNNIIITSEKTYFSTGSLQRKK